MLRMSRHETLHYRYNESLGLGTATAFLVPWYQPMATWALLVVFVFMMKSYKS